MGEGGRHNNLRTNNSGIFKYCFSLLFFVTYSNFSCCCLQSRGIKVLRHKRRRAAAGATGSCSASGSDSGSDSSASGRQRRQGRLGRQVSAACSGVQPQAHWNYFPLFSNQKIRIWFHFGIALLLCRHIEKMKKFPNFLTRCQKMWHFSSSESGYFRAQTLAWTSFASGRPRPLAASLAATRKSQRGPWRKGLVVVVVLQWPTAAPPRPARSHPLLHCHTRRGWGSLWSTM